MYTAVVLVDESRDKLIRAFASLLEANAGFEVLAHHMTLHMGSAEPQEAAMVGSFVTLVADAIAQDDKVIAVRIIPWGIKSKNPIPHITLAVNRQNGGKPKMSNDLKAWEPIEEPISLRGRLEEVK